MFISNKEKESIKRDCGNLWNNVNTLYEGKRQMNNLFAKDRHGTIRPKVDMLTDVVDKTYLDAAKEIIKVNTNLWIEINKLNERIEKLEKDENPKNKKD